MSKKTEIFSTAFAEYKVLNVHAEGGAGIVYQVEDESGNIFALKSLNPEKITKQRVKRFKNEIQFCTKNVHKNIVKVLDWGFSDRKGTHCPFYIMPFYAETLRSLMKHRVGPNSVLPFYSQILDGVECAHLLNVFHRDLKPENVLYDSSNKLLIICDFGIAHFSEEDLSTAVDTKESERLASFQYAAPEQRIKGRKVDQRADIYSLGLILNEMFTNQCPLGTGYKKVSVESPNYGYIDGIVEDMLQQSPDARLQTIGHVKDILIGARNEFIIHQKLSELKKEVILTSEVEDILISSPPRLLDVDYKNRCLILKLSCAPSLDWVNCFHNIGGWTAVWGYEPENFKFSGDEASIFSPENLSQRLVDNFKEYLNRANQDYKIRKIAEHRQAEEEQRKVLRKQIEDEETRQRIRNSIKL